MSWIYILWLFLFGDIYGGCGMSSCNSKPKKSAKVAAIETVVKEMPLERVLMFHLRTKTIDFEKYNISDEDKAYFRSCVAAKYEDNKKEIDAMAQESNTRYVKAVAVPIARSRRKQRHQRITFAVPSASITLKVS